MDCDVHKNQNVGRVWWNTVSCDMQLWWCLLGRIDTARRLVLVPEARRLDVKTGHVTTVVRNFISDLVSRGAVGHQTRDVATESDLLQRTESAPRGDTTVLLSTCCRRCWRRSQSRLFSGICLSVCLFVCVSLHGTSRTDAARITTFNVEMSHDASCKSIYFGVSRSKGIAARHTKHCQHGFALLWVLVSSDCHYCIS